MGQGENEEHHPSIHLPSPKQVATAKAAGRLHVNPERTLSTGIAFDNSAKSSGSDCQRGTILFELETSLQKQQQATALFLDCRALLTRPTPRRRRLMSTLKKRKEEKGETLQGGHSYSDA
jgi:hypothetical protein